MQQIKFSQLLSHHNYCKFLSFVAVPASGLNTHLTTSLDWTVFSTNEPLMLWKQQTPVNCAEFKHLNDWSVTTDLFFLTDPLKHSSFVFTASGHWCAESSRFNDVCGVYSSSGIFLYIVAFILPLILAGLPVPAAGMHPHSMRPLLSFTVKTASTTWWAVPDVHQTKCLKFFPKS